MLAPGDQQALLGAAQGKPCSAAAAADSKAPAALKRQVLGADVHEVHQLTPDTILHVAMEYTIPHLGYDDQFVYGGLGKVVDVFLRCWQGPLALCCPLYRGGSALRQCLEVPMKSEPLVLGWQMRPVLAARVQCHGALCTAPRVQLLSCELSISGVGSLTEYI